MSSPWLKFYPSDWRSDPALRMCSLSARGLWMEMLCLMHEATPRGHLLVNGRQLTAKQLAGLVGSSPKEVEEALTELEEAGVFSLTDNRTIVSRRMVRDDEKAERDKANGKGGGNPKLKAPVNPQIQDEVIGGVNPQVKAHGTRMPATQKPEARSQKEPSHQQPELEADADDQKVHWTRATLDKLEADCRKAAGVENHPSTGLLVIGPIADLIDSGWSLERHILPALRAAKAKGGKPGSTWAYYAKIVTNGATEPPKAAPPPTESASTAELDPRKMAAVFVNLNKWMWPDLPAPGQAGCPVTPEMIDAARFDQAEQARRIVEANERGEAA